MGLGNGMGTATCAGTAMGLLRVWVWVAIFVPFKNPYPQHRYRVTRTVTHHIKLCQLITIAAITTPQPPTPETVSSPGDDKDDTERDEDSGEWVCLAHPPSNKVHFPINLFHYVLTDTPLPSMKTSCICLFSRVEMPTPPPPPLKANCIPSNKVRFPIIYI